MNIDLWRREPLEFAKHRLDDRRTLQRLKNCILRLKTIASYIDHHALIALDMTALNKFL